jgi:hypothetical protein
MLTISTGGTSRTHRACYTGRAGVALVALLTLWASGGTSRAYVTLRTCHTVFAGYTGRPGRTYRPSVTIRALRAGGPYCEYVLEGKNQLGHAFKVARVPRATVLYVIHFGSPFA